jgi:hypothetical protein
MQGPEGRPPNVSPARKGWEIDPEEDPGAVGAALYRSSALPVSLGAYPTCPGVPWRDLQFCGPFLEMFFDSAQRRRRESDGCPTFASAYVGRKRWAPRISCHGVLPTSACAAFIKESRMEFANANKVYRKSRGSPTIALAESLSEPMSDRASIRTDRPVTIQNALSIRNPNSSFPSRPLASPGLPGSNAHTRFPIAHAWPPSQRTGTVNKAWR